MIAVRRALFSAYHKGGLLPLAQEVARWGGEIISSDGTASFLSAEGCEVTRVEEITGFGPSFGGRVKTLHPKIHGAILMRRDEEADLMTARELEIQPIDLVVVNLYPFSEALARNSPRAEAIELIDVGGPALVRAAAKNHRHVCVVTLPEDYDLVRAALRAGEGKLSEDLCRELAGRAFAVTAAYDAAIAGFFGGQGEVGTIELTRPPEGEVRPVRPLPLLWQVQAPRRRSLRYGENPSQQGGLYGQGSGFPFNLEQLLGKKDLSYNNLLDLDCGRDVVAEFGEEFVAAVIKHGIPCGVARGGDLAEAYLRAREADPLSAFGGVVVCGREVDASTAGLLNETFLEAVLAPAYTEEALGCLEKKKSRAILRCPAESLREPSAGLRGRFLGGGVLLQTPMNPRLGETGWKVVTRRAPSEAEARDLLFGWRVLKHVRSNAVLFAQGERTVGVGSGQCSRIDAVEMAIMKAKRSGLDLAGSVLVSDAFFPFRDCIDRAAAAGATAVLQPGGSLRDGESEEACNEHGLAMAINGARVFSHG